jgi:hypothetical protein
MRERLILFDSLASTPIQMDLFILCFSMDGGDRLSQWRGYGAGGGISIGFDQGELKNRCTAFTRASINGPCLPAWAFLNRVRYIHPTGDEQSNQVIDLLVDNPSPTEFEGRFSEEQVFHRRVCISSANLKHNAFREEQEWRIALFDVPDNWVRFRTRRSMIVPYVPFDLGKGSSEWPLIQKIIVGPCPHQPDTVAAIRRRVDERIVVSASSIPYRDW